MTYDILVSGCIALKGAQALALQHKDELVRRYGEAYIDKAIERRDPEIGIPADKGIRLIRQIAEGGINAA